MRRLYRGMTLFPVLKLNRQAGHGGCQRVNRVRHRHDRDLADVETSSIFSSSCANWILSIG
jgi:hypothetical protein